MVILQSNRPQLLHRPLPCGPEAQHRKSLLRRQATPRTSPPAFWRLEEVRLHSTAHHCSHGILRPKARPNQHGCFGRRAWLCHGPKQSYSLKHVSSWRERNLLTLSMLGVAWHHRTIFTRVCGTIARYLHARAQEATAHEMYGEHLLRGSL